MPTNSTPAAEPIADVIATSTGGCRIAMHDLGGTGPVLIIVHATGFHGHAYLSMLPALTPHFHVWAIDLRGHGASTAPDDGDFNWDNMAADLLAGIDAIGATSVVAFGHSMGGATVLLAACERPGAIEAAFLYEPVIFSELRSMDGDNPMVEVSRNRRHTFDSKADALWRYATSGPLQVMRSDALAAYVEHGFVQLPDDRVELACSGESEAAVFDNAPAMTLDRIRGIELRLAVAGGLAQDQASMPGLPNHLVAAVPGSILVEYPDLDHFGPFQTPARVGADVVAFLQGRLGPGRA